MKHVPSILAVGLLAAGCFSRAPKIPEGVVVASEPEVPPSPEAVAVAQRRLRSLEMYVGPIDGVLSPSTRVALARFQRSRELTVTGSLDPATAEALGLEPLESYPPAKPQAEENAPLRPTADEILETREARPLPQPPSGALDDARAAAASILADGMKTAADALTEAQKELPGDVARAMASSKQAFAALGSARQKAFDTLVDARRKGGWALLPQAMLHELESALEKRALLLRGVDGAMGEDDADAIRWLERSFGLPVTGRPSLVLLELLGIDTSPMFLP